MSGTRSVQKRYLNIICKVLSMSVPKKWLNIRILGAGFRQSLKQTWDHKIHMHSYVPVHPRVSEKTQHGASGASRS